MSKVGNTVAYWLEIASTLTPVPGLVIADHDEDGVTLLLAPYVDADDSWQDRDLRYAPPRAESPTVGSYTIPDPM